MVRVVYLFENEDCEEQDLEGLKEKFTPGTALQVEVSRVDVRQERGFVKRIAIYLKPIHQSQ